MSAFDDLVGDLNFNREPIQVVRQIPLDQITSNPDNPRKLFDERELGELAASIKERGVLQPITLRETAKDAYVVLFGDRRFRAAGLAGLRAISAIVSETVASSDLIDQVTENEQRVGLSAEETAAAVMFLLEEGLAKGDIARKIGRRPEDISMYVAVPKFPPELKGAFLESSSLRAAYDLYVAWKSKPDEVLQFVKEHPAVTSTQAMGFVRSLKGKANSPDSEHSVDEPGGGNAAEEMNNSGVGGGEATKESARQKRGKGTGIYVRVVARGESARMELPAMVEVEFADGSRAKLSADEVGDA